MRLPIVILRFIIDKEAIYGVTEQIVWKKIEPKK